MNVHQSVLIILGFAIAGILTLYFHVERKDKLRRAFEDWRKARRSLERWLERESWRGIKNPQSQWFLLKEITALERYLMMKGSKMTVKNNVHLMSRYALIREDALIEEPTPIT